MRQTPKLVLSLSWCLLGYYFLGRAEASSAMLASMASITTACLGRASGAIRFAR